MKRVILAISNDLAIDQRLHKVCLSLLNNGFDPLLVGRNKDEIPLPARPYKTKALPMIFTKGKLFYLELNTRLFIFLLFAKVDIITANDLDTLLPCFLVSKLRSKVLVYDSHEYFTELPELANRHFEKKIWTTLEKAIFPSLKRISTVGRLIAEEYQKKYKVPVAVVRNMPFRRGEFVLPTREKVLIYQGAVNEGRGLELMIEAMPLLPDYILWIIGTGPSIEYIKKLAESHKNIKLFGKIPFDELSLLTPKALLGLSLEEDLGLNYKYSLPNKIFDYVHANVPSICSDLPEMKRLVEEYRFGEVLKKRDPQTLALLVVYMAEKSIYQTYVNNCQEAAKVLHWESEEKVLLGLYR